MKTLAIARYTFVANLRNRILLVLALFGFLLLGSSILFGLLGQEQELRMLTDLGLSAIELLSLLTAVFLTSNLVLEEMESKNIYLVLTRSVGRMEYLLGRYLGTVLSVLVCIVLMTSGHLALLLAKHWKWQQEGALYLLSVFLSFEKILVISALALFFSLAASSAVVALVFTFFFWILGHFAIELKFLSGQIQGAGVRALARGVYWIIPHFQYLNARDLWVSVRGQIGLFAARGTLYALLYSALALLLALAAFRKKEF